jgi:hypothetical protein
MAASVHGAVAVFSACVVAYELCGRCEGRDLLCFAARNHRGPLLGVKPTSQKSTAMSAFDPLVAITDDMVGEGVVSSMARPTGIFEPDQIQGRNTRTTVIADWPWKA